MCKLIKSIVYCSFFPPRWWHTRWCRLSHLRWRHIARWRWPHLLRWCLQRWCSTTDSSGRASETRLGSAAHHGWRHAGGHCQASALCILRSHLLLFFRNTFTDLSDSLIWRGFCTHCYYVFSPEQD